MEQEFEKMSTQLVNGILSITKYPKAMTQMRKKVGDSTIIVKIGSNDQSFLRKMKLLERKLNGDDSVDEELTKLALESLKKAIEVISNDL